MDTMVYTYAASYALTRFALMAGIAYLGYLVLRPKTATSRSR